MGRTTEQNASFYSVLSTVCSGISYAVAHPVQTLVSALAIQATLFGFTPVGANPSDYHVTQFDRNPNLSAGHCAEMNHYQDLMKPKKPF